MREICENVNGDGYMDISDKYEFIAKSSLLRSEHAIKRSVSYIENKEFSRIKDKENFCKILLISDLETAGRIIEFVKKDEYVMGKLAKYIKEYVGESGDTNNDS
jgi:hypothetical protein